MFDKSQYKTLLQQYMDKYNVSYTSAIHLMALDLVSDYNISIY